MLQSRHFALCNAHTSAPYFTSPHTNVSMFPERATVSACGWGVEQVLRAGLLIVVSYGLPCLAHAAASAPVRASLARGFGKRTFLRGAARGARLGLSESLAMTGAPSPAPLPCPAPHTEVAQARSSVHAILRSEKSLDDRTLWHMECLDLKVAGQILGHQERAGFALATTEPATGCFVLLAWNRTAPQRARLRAQHARQEAGHSRVQPRESSRRIGLACLRRRPPSLGRKTPSPAEPLL